MEENKKSFLWLHKFIIKYSIDKILINKEYNTRFVYFENR